MFKASRMLLPILKFCNVSAFSPISYEWFDDISNFCLEGNSNGIDFLLYDLKGLITSLLKNTNSNRKKLKSITLEANGILRAEVRLTKPKVIRTYTDKSDSAGQITALSNKSKDIFLNTFVQAVPFGDFHKKDKAVEIIRREVKNVLLRRKMLQLVALIPEKKSLLLAQKALNYRRIDEVMNALAAIDLSPVTLSKRHDVKYLENLYTYL